MVQTWLWLGVFGMAIGSTLFGIGSAKARDERWKILYTLNFFICLIASALYLAMALGQGFSVIHGRPTFWARYITWFTSTPLLILDLTFLGLSNIPLLGALLGANQFMIATGAMSAISPKPINYIWYAVSCGAFLAIIYLLSVPYLQQAGRSHPRSGKVFRRLIAVHIFLWTLYPIVWMLAGTGVGILDRSGETAGFTLLDLASKVGFGFLSLNTLQQLERANDARSADGYESRVRV
jgi:bacteriorhodopsin